nr:type II toxin-antitoxin system RelE/ParE family toxin [Polymorphobacter sp. PAMC 29334]
MRPVAWIGSSYKDFRSFPDPVQDGMGYALFLAQAGKMYGDAKPLKGFGGAGVVEVVDDHQGDTYRAVYTVKFDEAVYVLHAFQKKSKQGRKTPIQDLEMIRRRLKAAEDHHRQHQTPKGTA